MLAAVPVRWWVLRTRTVELPQPKARQAVAPDISEGAETRTCVEPVAFFEEFAAVSEFFGLSTTEVMPPAAHKHTKVNLKKKCLPCINKALGLIFSYIHKHLCMNHV